MTMQVHGRSIRHAAIAIAAWTAWARAGYDDPVRIERSVVREKRATHVAIGTIVSYRPADQGTADRSGLLRYVAEIRVVKVEKGPDIRPGKTILVAFSSHLTPEILDIRRSVSDCGEYKLEPLTTELARVYMTIDPSRGFVADHPDDFFAIGDFVPRDLHGSRVDRAREIWLRRTQEIANRRRGLWMVIAVLVIPAGLVLGSIGRHLRDHRREFPTEDAW